MRFKNCASRNLYRVPRTIYVVLSKFICILFCLQQTFALLMRIAIVGFRLFIASLKILGPSPSNQVAFDGSKACMYDCTCSDVTNRILK